MASSRPRRNITAPKKFGEEEGYLLPTRELHHKARKVYRVLKERDLTKEFRQQTVYVLWPDDCEWYEAKLTKVNRVTWDAKLEYRETQEEEDINLSSLVKDGHIACIEVLGFDEPLQPGDIPVGDQAEGRQQNKKLRQRTSLQSSGLSSDAMSVEEHEKDLSLPQQTTSEGLGSGSEVAAGPKAVKCGHNPCGESYAPGFDGLETSHIVFHEIGDLHFQTGIHPSIHRSASDIVSQPLSTLLESEDGQLVHGVGLPHKELTQFPQVAALGEPRGAIAPQNLMAGMDMMDKEAAELEGLSPEQLSELLEKRAQGAGEEANHAANKTRKLGYDQTPGSTPSQQSGSGVREKICNQLVAVLEIAANELAKEEGTAGEETAGEENTGEGLPSAKEVGTAVEEELFQLCGWESKGYKAKARSLHFNLKDPKNPDLRAQVLLKKITAYDLVRMDAQQLASSEEKKWREQKTEEFLKQSVLDTDTAASFSTAAALKISKDLQKQRQAAAAPEIAMDTGASLGDHQSLARRSSMTGDGRVDATRGDELLAKLKSGGATELSVPEFDIAEEVRKAEAMNQESAEEEFHHIEVPPSPPLSPLKSSSEDEEMGEPEDKDKEVAEEPEAAVYDPSSPAVFEEPVELTAQGDDPQEKLPDWALMDVDEQAKAGKEDQGSEEKDKSGSEKAGNGASYSPTAGANSAYSPTSGWDDEIQDMAPLVLMPKSGAAQVGCKAWEGRVAGDSGDSFRVVCEAVAGLGDLGQLLPGQEVFIKGRVGLDKVESFLDDLRPSRNRTVTLGIMKLHQDATMAEQGFLNGLISHYTAKGRTAVIGPSPNMEGYLIPRCTLAARLCVTARNAVPLEEKAFIKDNIRGTGELLLVLIHKKDWKPSAGSKVAAGAVADAKMESVQKDWTGPNVMKWAGVSKEIAAEAGIKVEMGTSSQQVQSMQPRAVDPRLKDPRLRAGIREPDPAEKPDPLTDAGKAALPPGITPKAISDLADYFGIGSKGLTGGVSASQQSAAGPSQLGLRGAAIAVQPVPSGGVQELRQSSHNGASTSGTQLPGQTRLNGSPHGPMQGMWAQQTQMTQMQTQLAFSQSQGHPMVQQPKIDGAPGQGSQVQVVQVPGTQQQSVVVLQGKPQFLSYDPTTGKAVALDPSTVQYDPATNQIMLTGVLPPGAPSFPSQLGQGQLVQQLCGAPQGADQDRLLVNSQGVPILVKKAKKDHMGDVDMEVEEEDGSQRMQHGGHSILGPMQRTLQGYNGELDLQSTSLMDPMRGLQQGVPGMLPQLLQPPPPPPVQNKDGGGSSGSTRGFSMSGQGVRGRGRGRDDRRRVRGRGRSRRGDGSGAGQGTRGGSKSHYRDRAGSTPEV